MSSNTKFILPLALGFSLVTVTAFVVYYVFKKDEPEDKEEKVKTSRFNTIEVNVPKSIVPALIGRAGSNIKEIEKKSGATINFKKFSDKEYDVCIIRGKSETTQLAEMLVHDFIQNQPLIEEQAMTVPGWAVGRIIGTRGENINDISHRSGARVKIESGSIEDKVAQRQVSIRGTEKQIADAKKLIENCVAIEQCRRETEQAKVPRLAQRTPSPASSPAPGDHSEEPPAETGGAPIEVYVSAVSSPSRFWVQFVGPQVAQLDELVAHMTEYYGNKENRAAHALSHVSVGQVVAAVFRHDGRWYRARVDKIQPNEFDATQKVADVFYLDYGDSEYVATQELCELRADLLRLRFQAMECFLAGVRPAGKEEDIVGVTPKGQRWDRWHPQAVERFEELTQVARWKPLVSRTCTYRKSVASEGEKEKEIPGIKLFDVTDEGELDIAGVLVSEGWARAGAPAAPPATPTGNAPYGDLGNSRVLGMLEGGGARASSLPKDHKDNRGGVHAKSNDDIANDNDGMTASKSLASGLEKSDKILSISNFDLSYPDHSKNKLHLNGSHDFIQSERQNIDEESNESVPQTPGSPVHVKLRDEFKANMNRIDSHHSNLEALGRSLHDLQK